MPLRGKRKRAAAAAAATEKGSSAANHHPAVARASNAASASASASASSSVDADDQKSLAAIRRPADRSAWSNRQRTLVFSSRGISFRVRHLLNDLRVLMPHSKKDAKMDRKDRIGEIIPEICELKNCNNCVYIEMRKKKDVYMWVSKVPHGPSAKFLVQNLHTMDELKLTGNHLKGARPILSFDSAFDSTPLYRMLKELLFQVSESCRAKIERERDGSEEERKSSFGYMYMSSCSLSFYNPSIGLFVMHQPRCCNLLQLNVAVATHTNVQNLYITRGENLCNFKLSSKCDHQSFWISPVATRITSVV